MFIVCGEALFDVFATGSTPTGIGFDGRIGGSPFNVALGLARLGQPVGFCGGIGTGFAGERLMQALADEGIDARAVARVDAPTTLSLSAWTHRACRRMPSMAMGVPTGNCRPGTWRPFRPMPAVSTSAVMRWWCSRWVPPSVRWSSANTSAA